MTAALPFLPIAGEVKVKALEWHESLTDDGREQWHSNDRESITVMGNSFSDHERYWLFHAKKGFPSLQEAKASAQDDYEALILSALISSPAPPLLAVPVVTCAMVEKVCLDRWPKRWAKMHPSERDEKRDEMRRIILVAMNSARDDYTRHQSASTALAKAESQS